MRAAVALPALAAILCYLPALRNGFALDDVVIIAHDGLLHHFNTLLGALARPYWYDAGHLYRPLTTLSFGVEWAVGRGRPLLFHVVNVLWHATVAALVARLALRWWPPLAAAAAGCWFAVQPIHAEAVANVVGRSELVCAAALVGLALVASRRSDAGAGDSPGPAKRSPFGDRGTLWIAFGLALCAMASKETGAVAPAIAWAAAVTPVPGDGRTQAQRRRRAWRLAGAACSGIVCLLAARWLILGSLAGDAPHYAFVLAPGWRGLRFALATVPRAAWIGLVPQPPRLDYSPTDDAVLRPHAALVLIGALLAMAAATAAWSHIRRPSPWGFVVCLAAATYAPVSNLVVRTGVVLADRTLYSPSVSVALAIGAAVAAAWTARRWLVVAALGAVTVAAAVIAVSAEGAWRDSPTAYAAIRTRSPDSYVGHYMVAELRDDAGDASGARAEYAAAVALTPRHPAVLYMAGANALRLRDTASAMTLLARSVASRPDGARARTALAGLELRRGDTVSARALLDEGLRRDSTQRQWRSQLERLDAVIRATGAQGS